MLEVDYEVPKALCPECGYAFDAASSLSSNEKPDPGSLSICISCGELLMFDDDLRPILRAPADAYEHMDPLVRLRVVVAIGYIHRRGRLDVLHGPSTESVDNPVVLS